MDAVDTFVRRYPGSPVLQDVLGTADAEAIRAVVYVRAYGARCAHAFGTKVERGDLTGFAEALL